MVGEPYTVGRTMEYVAVAVHTSGLHLHYQRLAAPPTHATCRFHIARQVHVVPLPAYEPRPANRGGEASRGPMIQHIRRCFGLVSEIYREGMALIRPDSAAVGTEDETLLIILSDYGLEFLLGQGESVRTTGVEQLGHGCPTARVEPQPDPFGPMPQDQTQELADLNIGAGPHYATNTSVRRRVKSCSVTARTMARAILSPP